MAPAKKRLKKAEEQEDRLSALPDSLIHHILSFLPSTEEAIRACLLSKRWLRQWTRVPNLIFDFSGTFSDETIASATSCVSKIIDNVLIFHDCSKLKKFHIIAEDDFYDCQRDPNYDAKLYFAIRKQAEEIVLSFCADDVKFRLPGFFFQQDFLVKLQLINCSISPLGHINWGSLENLSLESCYFDDQTIRSIVSGSPMLQSLEVDSCHQFGRLEISSKMLKQLVLLNSHSYLNISCPNLVEFSFMGRELETFGQCDKALQKFLSDSPLLELLMLANFKVPNLRIDSKMLKGLLLGGVVAPDIEISCPHLEELDLSDIDAKTIRLMNLPSSICAALDFNCSQYGWSACKDSVARQILEQLQHLSELKLGRSFVGTLSALEMEGLSYPLLNRGSLTLEDPSCVHFPGIVCALRCSPALEKLNVEFQSDETPKLADLSEIDHSGESYWKSNSAHFSSLVPHLRIVKITGLSKSKDKSKLVVQFVKFLLRNASALEKILVTLKDCGTDFALKVSQKLLSFPRRSDAVVELLCSV